MVVKRAMWLGAGVALGAGSSLWVERRVRRAVQEAARQLAPNELVAGVGRTARAMGDRIFDAVAEGREAMRAAEEDLRDDLASRWGVGSPETAPALPAGRALGLGQVPWHRMRPGRRHSADRLPDARRPIGRSSRSR